MSNGDDSQNIGFLRAKVQTMETEFANRMIAHRDFKEDIYKKVVHNSRDIGELQLKWDRIETILKTLKWIGAGLIFLLTVNFGSLIVL